MKQLSLLILGAAFAGAAVAAPETYKIDNSHTFPRFSYSHFGFSTQLSRFNKTTGTITIDRAAKTGAVDITIDTKSVDTGNALFDEHIQAADFLATAQYPNARFVADHVYFDGDKVVSVDGTLTLKGISKPLTLTVTSFQCMPHPILKKDACGANATGLVKRTDFNMGKYAPDVGDEVTLTIAVEAVKK